MGYEAQRSPKKSSCKIMNHLPHHTQSRITRLQWRLVLVYIILVLIILSACHKDPLIIQGGTYRLKTPDKGWGVKDTVYVYSMYFNDAAGLEYCQCLGPSQGTPPGPVDSLNGEVNWKLPIDVLK